MNAFGGINWYQVMHTIAHQRNKDSRCAMICYCCHKLVYVRDDKGKPMITLHCKEGIPQGWGFSMFAYGISLMPLTEKMNKEIPEPLQNVFADNARSAGEADINTR